MGKGHTWEGSDFLFFFLVLPIAAFLKNATIGPGVQI